MTEMWIGCCGRGRGRDLARALRSVEPSSTLVVVHDAMGMRNRFADEVPGDVGAIVGLSDEGVSDLNLAAAIAHDGRAARVVLVTSSASGSLRSRARQAGVSLVVDLDRLDNQKDESGRAPARFAAPQAPSSPSASQGAPVSESDGGRPGEAPSRAEGEREAAVAAPSDISAGDGSAPVLAFASGRGGVGKTALVAVCAALAGSWGMRVALVDLDLSCGNLFACFGIRQPVDITRISGDGSPSNELLGRSCARCRDNVYLWGPCERPEMAELVMPHVTRLLGYLRERFDLVLVDTSTTFTDAVAQAVQAADRLVLVHDGAVGAIGPVSRASGLAVRLGVARTRIVRVENFADPRSRGEPNLGRAEVGLEGARLFRVMDGGGEVSECLSSGHAVELASEPGEFVDSVSLLLATLLNDLGALPESARFALEPSGHKPRFSLFSLRKAAN